MLLYLLRYADNLHSLMGVHAYQIWILILLQEDSALKIDPNTQPLERRLF